MKYIIPVLVLCLSFPLQSKDGYIKFGMGQQDGLNGGNDAKEYGLTVGKKLNDFFAAEVKTRTKLKDQSTGNDQRAEFALIGSVKLHDRIKMYTRAGAGRKFTRNKDHGYWHAEPGFSFKLTDGKIINIDNKGNFNLGFKETTYELSKVKSKTRKYNKLSERN